MPVRFPFRALPPLAVLIAAQLVLAVFGIAAAGAQPAPQAAEASGTAVVLAYERIGADWLPTRNTRIDQFAAHLQQIADSGHTVLPLGDIIDRLKTGESLPAKSLALTIDGAHASVAQSVWPLIKARGWPLTVFVATDPVDRGAPGMMSWDDLRGLAKEGVAIGNLSASAGQLVLSDAGSASKEIERASLRFDAELGFTPDLFAYPRGEISRDLRILIEQKGFKAAVGSHAGVVHGDSAWYALPRFVMNEQRATAASFANVLAAQPLRVRDAVPGEWLLPRLATPGINPPSFGFTAVAAGNGLDLKDLTCYASGQSGPAKLWRPDESRVEVLLDLPFRPGRSRITCVVPGADDTAYWYGAQFFVPPQ